ncbi:MAG: hypothetical protein CML68_11700 [Rhodobacteraceae bacterium]|nr:hypothetical protein [Paracoccaceae bacterium]
MPMIRINAEGPRMVPGKGELLPCLMTAARGRGPIIVMIHGYKYQPGHPQHCPHRKILSLHPNSSCVRAQSWPRRLGFGTGHAAEGLGVAFGWDARGALWSAQARAKAAGSALAELIGRLHRIAPGRPLHVIAHSMGTEVALEALSQVAPGSVGRVVSMTGACYRSRAEGALDTGAGRKVEFFNIVSRENDPFDFLFERLIAPGARGDRSIGHGLDAPNAVTIQIDCPDTLGHLEALGHPLPGPAHRVCHWSSYTRPGILRLYNDLLRQPSRFPLALMRRGVPQETDPRWSRLLVRPALPVTLPFLQNAS